MQKHVYAILLSVLLGHAYYQMMEASIPTESNCSYMAAPMTDYLAFLWGFILVGYGFKYDNAVLTVLGASIVVEHIFQYEESLKVSCVKNIHKNYQLSNNV
jgi:hypothetical protein